MDSTSHAFPSIACRRCGRPIDPSGACYSPQGELVCPACAVAPVVDRRQARTGALATLAMGALSVVFNPLFVCSVAAAVLGLRSRRRLSLEGAQAALGDGHRALYAATVAGLALAGFGASLWLILMPLAAFAYWFGQGMSRAL
jgi:hypothetical protein